MNNSLKFHETLAAVASGINFEKAYAASREDIMALYAFFIQAAEAFEEDDSLEWLDLIGAYIDHIDLYIGQFGVFPGDEELKEIMEYAKAQCN